MIEFKGFGRKMPTGAWRSSYLWLLLGCVLTILVMWAYPYLPDKRLQLVHEDMAAYLYSDSRNSVEWLDREELRWRCRIVAPHNDAYCGLSIDMLDENGSGKDLARYTEIRLDLSYTGPSSELRYYIRNFEPGFSDPNNLATNKPLQTEIPLEFIDDGLTIGLDEFYVAEWWLAQFEVPRAFRQPNFSHVTGLGVDLPYQMLPGDHEVQLRNAELVGVWLTREQWYVGIMVTWLVALGTAGIGHTILLRRSVLRERRRLAELASRHRTLRSESAKFRDLSRKDQLTGLLNRHGATEAIEALFAAPETPLSLLVIDIDHFKPINDYHGHSVGDKILAQLGHLLQNSIRQHDYAARWGGEEFIVLLPETEESNAFIIAEKLRLLVAETAFEALPAESVTVSLGAGQRQPGEPYHQLFRRVDMALYQAKERGRNQTAIATAG